MGAKIQGKEAFAAVTEAQAEKMFKDYQKDLGETCLHNHGKRKNKKSKKKKKASSSSSDSDAETEKRKSRKRNKKKKKKKKKARAKSVSESRSPVSSEAEDSHRSRRGRDSASPPRRKHRTPSDESIEEGELSEDELERKRMQLLKQLQEDD